MLNVMIAVVPVVRTTGLGALRYPRQPRKDSRIIVYWSKSETNVGLTGVYLPESACVYQYPTVLWYQDTVSYTVPSTPRWKQQ